MIRNNEFYTRIQKPRDALDCLHWLVDSLPTEAWEELPEPLQKRITELTEKK
jgi:hypothetical protein